MPTLTKSNARKANRTGKSRQNDYAVKDLSLAEWGRKEISVAEQEMPGLIRGCGPCGELLPPLGEVIADNRNFLEEFRHRQRLFDRGTETLA